MPTRDEYATRPIEQRLARLARTADELAAAVGVVSDATLSRRPEATSWSAKEIVCHLRDIEELAMMRFRMMLAMEEPRVLVAGAMPIDLAAWGLREGEPLPVDPNRWAEERQYLRHDGDAALAAFRRRRADTLAFVKRLTPVEWPRGSVHPTLGRMTYGDWLALLAGHDDNHVDQLRRALDGRA
jgi:DinB superfamily